MILSISNIEYYYVLLYGRFISNTMYEESKKFHLSSTGATHPVAATKPSSKLPQKPPTSLLSFDHLNYFILKVLTNLIIVKNCFVLFLSINKLLTKMDDNDKMKAENFPKTRG